MNAYPFEQTLSASDVFSDTSTDPDTRINGFVHARLMRSSLKSRKIVAQGIVKPLTSRRICSTINPKPTQSPQDVRVSTRLFPIPGVSPPNDIIYGTHP